MRCTKSAPPLMAACQSERYVSEFCASQYARSFGRMSCGATGAIHVRPASCAHLAAPVRLVAPEGVRRPHDVVPQSGTLAFMLVVAACQGVLENRGMKAVRTPRAVSAVSVLDHHAASRFSAP